MTERPIIFSSPMVRAILDGRKTQTRRVLKPQPQGYGDLEVSCLQVEGRDRPQLAYGRVITKQFLPFAVGDRLWVREACWICPAGWTDTPVNPMGPHRQEVAYAADDTCGGTREAARDYKLKLRPSIHMPRWASRITLEVTGVKVQRLQEISVLDARDESVAETWGEFLGNPPEWAAASIMGHGDASGPHIYDNRTSPENFRVLWESIHGPGAWEANPWVCAITFRRVE